jgi:hypothetical protein
MMVHGFDSWWAVIAMCHIQLTAVVKLTRQFTQRRLCTVPSPCVATNAAIGNHVEGCGYNKQQQQQAMTNTIKG